MVCIEGTWKNVLYKIHFSKCVKLSLDTNLIINVKTYALPNFIALTLFPLSWKLNSLKRNWNNRSFAHIPAFVPSATFQCFHSRKSIQSSLLSSFYIFSSQLVIRRSPTAVIIMLWYMYYCGMIISDVPSATHFDMCILQVCNSRKSSTIHLPLNADRSSNNGLYF